MASRLAPPPQPVRLLTAEEFLQIDFGPDLKAELDRGVIEMMAGGSRGHARIQGNLMRYFGAVLRGSGCRPCGSDIKVCSHPMSVRYPDVTIDCGAPSDEDSDRLLNAPCVIVEILSPSTRAKDLGVKLEEYCTLPSVQTIAFVDPETERLRVYQRTGPESFNGTVYAGPAALDLPTLGISMPHDEIFARD